MKISRELEVGCWDHQAATAAQAYWSQRGFTNAAIGPGPELVGTRGSWLGNFTSFNMSKLRASLRMSPVGPERVAVELDVNTLGQQITQWNRAYWRLEIIEVGRILRGDGDISDMWQRFLQASRKASIKWAFSAMFFGQRLPDDWEDAISGMEHETRIPSDRNRNEAGPPPDAGQHDSGDADSRRR